MRTVLKNFSIVEFCRKKKVKKFIRFQIVSVAGTVVNPATIWLLKAQLTLPVMLAGAIAIEVAIIHNFTWHFFVTWKERIIEHSLSSYLRNLFTYNLVTASIDYLVNLTVLYVLHKRFGVYYLLAHFIGMVCGPVFKFLANEFIVFRHKVHDHKKKPTNHVDNAQL